MIAYTTRARGRGPGLGYGYLRGPGAIRPGFDGAAPNRCQYIEGEPSADDACKCGKPAIEGKSWCPEHYSMVYVAYVPKAQREAA